MARVEHRKARKDYPDQGISKGDQYYYARLKTGPRSSHVIRSLQPIPQSQLTGSHFLSTWYGTAESLVGEFGHEDVSDAAETLRNLGSDAQDSFENMPEGLQQGDTGILLEDRATRCEAAAEDLEELSESMREAAEDDEFDSDEKREEALQTLRDRVDEVLQDSPE